MPTYEYRCLSCDQHFEVVQSFKDEPLTRCQCGKDQPVRKVFQPIGITFKGGGFYKTDSRGSKSESSSSSSSSETSSSSSSSGSSGAGSSGSGSSGAGSSGSGSSSSGSSSGSEAKSA